MGSHRSPTTATGFSSAEDVVARCASASVLMNVFALMKKAMPTAIAPLFTPAPALHSDRGLCPRVRLRGEVSEGAVGAPPIYRLGDEVPLRVTAAGDSRGCRAAASCTRRG